MDTLIYWELYSIVAPGNDFHGYINLLGIILSCRSRLFRTFHLLQDMRHLTSHVGTLLTHLLYK